MIVVTIAILAFFVYYFYKKFTVTREILKYEVNDVRNMSTIPKSEAELKDMSKKISGQKYANLTDESQNV